MNCELMLTYDTPALRQTGSRNLTGPKTLPTIWYTYMMLVTKNATKNILDGRKDGRTEVKQYTPSPFGEIIIYNKKKTPIKFGRKINVPQTKTVDTLIDTFEPLVHFLYFSSKNKP